MKAQKFNEFVKAFAVKVTAFAAESGGSLGDTRVITVRSVPATVEISVSYGSVRLAFLYHVGRGNGPKSVLSCLLSRAGDPQKLSFLMYDVVNIIDEQDFSAYTYAYLNDTAALERAFDSMSQRISRNLDKICELFGDEERFCSLSRAKREDICGLFGRDVFERSRALESDERERYLSRIYDMFYSTVISRFASYGYSRFTAGDSAAALKRYGMLHHLTAYERRLVEYIKAGGRPQTGSEHDLLAQGLEADSGRGQYLAVLVSCLLMSLAAIPLFFGLYMLFAWLLSRGALYSTAFELKNAVTVIAPAVGAGVCASWFVRPLFFSKKQRELRDRFKEIISEKGSRPFMRYLMYTVIALCVVVTMQMANYGARFYDDRVEIVSSMTVLRPVEYMYSEIESCEGGRVMFSDGRGYDLGRVADIERMETIMKK